tara:strand:+ start:131 stop:235 length:105 start_codon:yes stop_codon:yes gene_type:complete
MEHEASYWILKVFIWGAIWMIAFEAMAANKRQGG